MLWWCGLAGWVYNCFAIFGLGRLTQFPVGSSIDDSSHERRQKDNSLEIDNTTSQFTERRRHWLSGVYNRDVQPPSLCMSLYTISTPFE